MPIQNETPELQTPGSHTKTYRGDGFHESTPRALVLQARCELIRESLAADLYRIAGFTEAALIAIDSEDDHTLIRMSDQLFKTADRKSTRLNSSHANISYA